jgi:hypothetical protein
MSFPKNGILGVDFTIGGLGRFRNYLIDRQVNLILSKSKTIDNPNWPNTDQVMLKPNNDDIFLILEKNFTKDTRQYKVLLRGEVFYIFDELIEPVIEPEFDE